MEGRCGVLAGQVHRSGGGLAYGSFSSFEAALDELLGDPALRTTLGNAGRAYVRRMYDWDSVLNRYIHFVEEIVSGRVRPARAAHAARER